MATIADDLLRSRIKVLFVSPERLASAAFRRLIRPKYDPVTGKWKRDFPPVSLLCVDEAHCLSQWGHNFRPSYLRIRGLTELLDPRSVLALTATAGPAVVGDICRALGIPGGGVDVDVKGGAWGAVEPSSGVKVLECERDNIDVAAMVVDTDDERRRIVSVMREHGFVLLFDLCARAQNAGGSAWSDSHLIIHPSIPPPVRPDSYSKFSRISPSHRQMFLYHSEKSSTDFTAMLSNRAAYRAAASLSMYGGNGTPRR